MTLWLPLLDYARSYEPLSREVAKLVGKSACVEIYGISTAQAAALQYHGRLKLRQATPRPVCPYLVVDADFQSTLGGTVHLPDWILVTTVRRPKVDRKRQQDQQAALSVSELKVIARHAATVLVGQLAVMAFGVADTMIAGRYSDTALA
eukprot:gene21878-30074_t